MRLMLSETVRLAYRGQQRSLRGVSSVVSRIGRRLIVGKEPPPSPKRLEALGRSFEDMLDRDFANAAAGIYPWSLLFQIPFGTYARALPRLARDLPNVVRRRERGDYGDLPEHIDLRRYPPYYRRTFHWQSDGYLSRRSAELYDVGVELLFGGTADVMRRQVIPPIVAHARGLDRPLRVLEVACGTARTGAQLLRALPDTSYTGLDLSPYYLEVARDRVGGSTHAHFVVGNAESLPFDDASFDAICCVYLFHELPRNARRKVWSEMRRVLRPGGCVVIEDSLQPADAGDLDLFLDRFPEDMHEPFYRDYLRDDLAEGLEEVGLVVGLRSLVGDEPIDLYEVIRRRYERGSIILTSNRAVAEWAPLFKDELLASAALDRLLHHAHVVEITGHSFRNPPRELGGTSHAA